MKMKSVVHKAFILKINKTLIFITIGLLTINTGLKATAVATQCQPFSPLFLWYTGTGEDPLFFLQYRLLVTSIEALPENTNVSVVTFGAGNNIRLNFIKQAGHTNWRTYILKYKPGKATNHAISYKEIHQEISNYYKSNGSRKAEIVYILVNNKTERHDTENDLEELRRKKMFVILSGIQTINRTHVWLKLASNEQHFVEFKGNEDIKKTAETILFLSCKDSMYVCDTDMYWWYEKGECNTCTYICSKSCTMQPEFCTIACPYFPRNGPGKDETMDTDNIIYPLHENIGPAVFANCGLIIIIVVIGILGILVIFVGYKKRRTAMKCVNSFRRRISGSQGSTPFVPGVEDNDLENITYIFEQNDSLTNEEEYFVDSKMIKSNVDLRDSELALCKNVEPTDIVEVPNFVSDITKLNKRLLEMDLFNSIVYMLKNRNAEDHMAVKLTAQSVYLICSKKCISCDRIRFFNSTKASQVKHDKRLKIDRSVFIFNHWKPTCCGFPTLKYGSWSVYF